MQSQETSIPCCADAIVSRCLVAVVAEWQITRVAGKRAIYVGQVQRTDATAAIRLAIKKFEIDAEHPSRVPARPIRPRSGAHSSIATARIRRLMSASPHERRKSGRARRSESGHEAT